VPQDPAPRTPIDSPPLILLNVKCAEGAAKSPLPLAGDGTRLGAATVFILRGGESRHDGLVGRGLGPVGTPCLLLPLSV
jgi:hypothetical protein